MRWGLIESLARGRFGSGHGSRNGSCIFWVLGVFQGLEGSGKRRGLGWSGLVVKCGCSENFSRGPPVLVRGSR